MFSLQHRVHLQLQGELDGLARRPGGSNDDDAAFGMRSESVGVGIWRKVVVAGWMHL
jgi:hypothetical protein